MKILVTSDKVLNAATRDIASGKPDSEKLVMAYLKVKAKSLPFGKRMLLKFFGPGQYRGFIRFAHKTLGTESVEVDV